MKKLKSLYLPFALLVSALGLHSQPLITADQSSVNLVGQTGGQPVQQVVNINAASGASAQFVLAQVAGSQASGAAWLRFGGDCKSPVTGTSGTTPFSITIIADPSCVAAGTYSGQILVYPPSAPNQGLTINVNFSVSSIGANPASLQFTYQSGSAVPGQQTINLTSSTALSFTAASSANWLDLSTSGQIIGGAGTVFASLDPNVTPTLAAGTYNATVTITPTGSSNNTPFKVPVTLTVTLPPPLTFSSTTVPLNFQISGTNNQNATLTLSNGGSSDITFGVQPSSATWLTVTPTGGTVPAKGTAQLTIGYNGTLQPGTYTATFVISSNGAPAQQTITVNLLVSNSPLLSLDKSALSFVYELNSGVAVPAQNVIAISSNVATSAPTASQISVGSSASTTNGGNWLSVAPAFGTTGSATPFSVTVNPNGLVPGKYQGLVQFNAPSAGNGPQNVAITLTVANDPSITTNLSAAAPSLIFAQQIGQPAVGAQTLTVGSSTGATLNYTATATTASGGSWLSVNGNTSGSSPNSFTVSVNTASLAAGTYNGTVTITAANPATGNAAVNSPLTIPVKLYVSTTALLIVTLPGNPPGHPFLTAPVNGAQASTQLTLSSSDPNTILNYNVTTSGGSNWLLVNPTGSTAAGSNILTIAASPSGLTPGIYNGSVIITTTNNGVADSPYTVPVTFQVGSGTLSLNTGSLSFTQNTGGPAPATQSIQVKTDGPKLTYTAVANSTAGWLTVSPGTGDTTANPTLTVSVDGSKLTPGTYNGTIVVTSPNAAGSPAVVNVSLTVTSGTISADQTSLIFNQVQNGPAPQAKTINVSGSPASLNFTVAATTATGGNWLTATAGSSGASGSTPGTVQVSASAGSLGVGQYTGTVTITSQGAGGSPISIPVTLNVLAPQTLTVTPSGTVAFNYNVGAPAPQAQQVQVSSTGATTFTTTVKTTDGANWLSVSPANGNLGTTAVSLSIAVNPSALTAGNYTGTVTINSPNAAAPAVVNVTLAVAAIPPPAIVGIRNTASGATGSIAPGEIIAIFGTGVGPATPAGLQLANGKVATTVANTQVLFDGTVAAPITFASSTQTNVVVPYEIAGRPTTNITVVYQGVTSQSLTYSVVQAQPGIYSQNLSGSGPGAIVNQSGTVNGASNAAPVGSVVAVYLTGDGNTTPQAATGGVSPADGSTLYKTAATVTAAVGGVSAQVLYSGSSPGFVFGLTQVNVMIPAGVSSGTQPVTIFVNGVPTQSGITVQVQ